MCLMVEVSGIASIYFWRLKQKLFLDVTATKTVAVWSTEADV